MARTPVISSFSLDTDNPDTTGQEVLSFVGSLTGLTQSGPQIDGAAVGYLPRAASALPNPPSIPSGSGKQYWVSPNGSDTADGLSQATAFKTLQRAQSVTNPGDVVNVLPGTYTAPNARDVLQINRAGSAAAWITYKAAPGAKIQVSPNNWMGVEVLAPYIIVEGFEVIGNARSVTRDFALHHAHDGTIPQTNSYGVGIGSHHVRILDNKIHDNSGHGIGGGGDYVVISGNDVYGNGNWSPYATGGVSQVQQGARQFDNAPGYHNFIIGNSIHDNVELIGNAWAGGAITDGNGIIIDSNQLGTTPYTGRTLISNNVLTNNGAAGVLVYQSAHVDVFSNSSVNNNFNVKEGEILAAKASDVRMFSNIMVARSGSYATGGGYADTNVAYDYNVVSGPAAYGATPYGPHDKLVAPLFGELGNWTVIGAVQTQSGYDVAGRNTSTGQYTAWTTDSNGNYTGSLTGGAVSGTGSPLESLEPVFRQGLNRDGVIGLTTNKVIQQAGSTSLTQVANHYYLYGSSRSGPALKYKGASVTAGEFGSWTPIGAMQTASGYDVAWKNTGTGQYTVWSTDSNGNHKGNLTGGAVSGTSHALESLEPVFHQDLNRDGVIGLYVAPGTTRQIANALAGTTGSATIGIGATLELTAADSASVTFAGSTGTLRLDHSATFSGNIFKFSGNGSLSGSNHIDLRDIKYGDVYGSYDNGVLTVTDGSGDKAKLSFNGSYTLANFKFASDGSGGTMVYDPPIPAASKPSVNQMAGRSPLAEGSFGSNLALFGNYIASTFANPSHGGGMVINEASQSDQSVLCSPKHT